MAATHTEEVSKDNKSSLNFYTGMAHYVGEKLHIRPNEILDTWCVPELIVAYGHYMNEESQKSYHEWKSLDTKARNNTPKPQEFAVQFYGVE